jgi:hypothetical protein
MHQRAELQHLPARGLLARILMARSHRRLWPLEEQREFSQPRRAGLLILAAPLERMLAAPEVSESMQPEALRAALSVVRPLQEVVPQTSAQRQFATGASRTTAVGRHIPAAWLNRAGRAGRQLSQTGFAAHGGHEGLEHSVRKKRSSDLPQLQSLLRPPRKAASPTAGNGWEADRAAEFPAIYDTDRNLLQVPPWRCRTSLWHRPICSLSV